MSKRFTEGICGDGAAILDNGKQITITEILNNLNKLDEIEQLALSRVSCSELLNKAKQMQKENQFMINGAKGHDSLTYYKGVGIGIDRIIKLIKRHCN